MGEDVVVGGIGCAEERTRANDDINEEPLAGGDADFLGSSETLAELWPALLQAFGGLEA